MNNLDTYTHTLWAVAARTLALLGALAFLTVNMNIVFDRDEAVAVSSAPTASPSAHTSSTARVVSEARILFVGDMFFDRQIRFVSSMQGSTFPFSCIEPLLQSADLVVGNLEGPITANPSVSFGTIPGSPNNYRFTFPTTTATMLYRHNIRVVTLGNNHILNFGWSGLASTHTHLDAVGVGYFGGVAGNEPVYEVSVDGVPLSFVSYNQFGGSSPGAVANTIDAEKKKGNEVLVFAHWGVEYSTSTATMRSIATLFAVNGAAAVIGSHPHVVGVHEQIASTTVYYSLGNFIFDQYFSSAVMHGLVVLLTISKDGVIGVQEYPTELERDGRTCLANK